MKAYKELPAEIQSGWLARGVDYPSGSGSVPFHYHDVEEWLQVLEGDMRFFPVGEEHSHGLRVGDVLNIEPGEVHRVELGSEGVKYRMWLLAEVADGDFQHKLNDDDLDLLRQNLKLPQVENQWDLRPQGMTVEQSKDGRFLNNLMSSALIFRGASGKFLGKNSYVYRPATDMIRVGSGTISILFKSADSMLLSTAVGTQHAVTGERASYLNLRFFVKEAGSWRCRVWLNFPEQPK